MNNWDLQAVVRGCGAFEDYSAAATAAAAAATATMMQMDNPESQSCYVPSSFQFQPDHELFFSSGDLFQDELEQFYKPFYHGFHPLSPQTILNTSISVPEEPKPSLASPGHGHDVTATSRPTTTTTSHAPQSKRSRKNLHKRVVKQVTEDGLSSDIWSWRKYGQKPIKGSPYPRSYYRCSTMKGCLAKKQVERSSTDPGMFILTYTGEHSHTHSITRRSSLPGGTKNKPTAPKTPTTTSNPNTPTVKDTACTATVLSPTTPLTAFIEDEFLQDATKLERGEAEGEHPNDQCDISDVTPNNSDLFPNLEVLDGLISDIDLNSWFSDEFPAAFT